MIAAERAKIELLLLTNARNEVIGLLFLINWMRGVSGKQRQRLSTLPPANLPRDDLSIGGG
jgi:hypothetical protein